MFPEQLDLVDPDDPDPDPCPATTRPGYASKRCEGDLPIRKKTYYIVDDSNEVIYCFVPKVACSTFKAVMASSASRTNISRILQGKNKITHVHFWGFLNRHGLRNLNSYSSVEAQLRLNTYFKFMAVRHPFDRLLSAWRDKIENGTDTVRTKKATPEQKRSFRIFVRSVANGHLNGHWMPMTKACDPCAVTFDSIVKLETANRDIPPILAKLPGPDGRASTLPRANRMSPFPPQQKLKTLREFYADVEPRVIDALLELYQRDFELFGYGWDKRRSVAVCGFRPENGTINGCC